MASTYEQKLNDLIENIKDKDTKTMLKVASKNKLYPKDCLTNGALEKLITYIIALEKRVEHVAQ
jgi:hypothetical protein